MTIPFQLLLIFLISFLSYKYIEYPFSKEDNRSNNINYLLKTFLFICISIIPLLGLTRKFKNVLYLDDICEPTELNTCKGSDHPHAPITPFIENSNIKEINVFIRKNNHGINIINV